MTTAMQGQINEDNFLLSEFHEGLVVRLHLNGDEQPNVMIIGKVVVFNSDGDPQDAKVRLTFEDGRVQLDEVDIRLMGTSSQAVTLIGWIRPPDLTPNSIVDLRVSTFNGFTQHARLIAIGET
jgi:hypothetical protein